MAHQYGLIFGELDNIILDNYWRKFYTYKELGWDDKSIQNYLADKKNIMQIASFNTPSVSFSASSRRNRFYEVYNRLDMVDKDVAYENALACIEKLTEKYDIYIISSRTEDLQEKTLEMMKNLKFPVDKIKVLFKKTNEVLNTFRQNSVAEIAKTNPTGFAVCLTPSEGSIYERNNYTPLGFTSLKDIEEFNGEITTVCDGWPQLIRSLWI
jgi:hypothetical protein